MQKIDCTFLRDVIIQDARNSINNLGNKVKLVVVQVEGDAASDRYVNSKRRACENLGIEFEHVKLSNDISFWELYEEMHVLDADDSVTGLMLQLPLPDHLNPYKQILINSISPMKDVDGLTTISKGRAWSKDKFVLKACTAVGISKVIKWYNKVENPNVCIVGRSDLIGKPLVDILSTEFNATVTLCHSKTRDLKKHTSDADIVVLATGQAKMFDKTYFKNDAMVIDAGIEFDENGKLCGDADNSTFEGTDIRFTPVPKGVGLLTVAQLMENVAIANYLQNK